MQGGYHPHPQKIKYILKIILKKGLTSKMKTDKLNSVFEFTQKRVWLFSII